MWNGGLNPRLSGAAQKTGTNFAANSCAARVRSDGCPVNAASRRRRWPKASDYRDLSLAKIGREIGGDCSIACSPTQNIQRSGRQARRISDGILTAGNKRVPVANRQGRLQAHRSDPGEL